MSIDRGLRSPTLHATVGFTGLVFVSLLVMASVFEVEVVATGRGKVVPTTRVQVIQPEFGGAIAKIAVRDGQSVRKGDTLITFDARDATADLQRLEEEARQLQIEVLRIEALIAVLSSPEENKFRVALERSTLVYPISLKDLPFAAEQERLFQSEIAALASLLAQHDAQIENNNRAVDVARVEVERISAALITGKERHDSAKSLLESGSTSRRTYLDSLDTYTTLQKEEDRAQRTLEEKESVAATLRAGLVAQITARVASLQERLSDIDRRMGQLVTELRVARRRQDATVLLAPQSGTVDQLQVHTLGGVVSPGAELLRIVPNDGKVEIEALFSNADIGFLTEGLDARLRFDAFPSVRFGAIDGTVTDVSADSREIDKGQFGYVVRIRPNTHTFIIGGTTYPVSSGMTMNVDVVTRSRTVISYFLQPILESIHEGMKEH